MKKKDLTDLRTKSTQDLKKLVLEKKYTLSQAMAQGRMGTEKNIKLPWNLKREIAKISTIIREQEIALEDSQTK